jgi:hypothetical protein
MVKNSYPANGVTTSEVQIGFNFSCFAEPVSLHLGDCLFQWDAERGEEKLPFE